MKRPIRTERPGVVLVESDSRPGEFYVMAGFGTPFTVCSCPGSRGHGACKHTVSAYEMTAQEMKEPMNEEMTKAVAVAQRSTAVQRAEQARLQVMEHLAGWDAMKALASEHIRSGFAPPEVKSPEAGALIIQKAIELDIPITSAYAYIDIIKGRPALRAQMIGALVQRSGKGTITITETNAMKCTAEGRRDGRVCRITCDIASFKMDTEPWKRYPADMLRNKAIARVGRFMFSDVLAGMEAAGAGEVVDSLYSVEDVNLGRVEVVAEESAPETALIDGEYHPVEPPVTAPAQPAMALDADADVALFDEFIDALNEHRLMPGALSPAMKAAIGSGQWGPDNAIEWSRRTGKSPRQLVAEVAGVPA